MISAADKNDPAPGRLIVASADNPALRDLLPDDQGHVSDLAWLDKDTIAFLGDEGTATVIGTVNADGSSLSTAPTGEIIATIALGLGRRPDSGARGVLAEARPGGVPRRGRRPTPERPGDRE